MRTAILLCVLAMVMFVAGCIGLSREDQIAYNRLTAEEQEKLSKLYHERSAVFDFIAAETRKIREKVADGTLVMSEGKEYLELLGMEAKVTLDRIVSAVSETKESYSVRRDDLKTKGYGTGDVVVGFIASILANLGIVRGWRGSVNDRAGNIGVRS